MSRFAANLTMMYREHPFLARFSAAARDGFGAVEYLFPYDYPAKDLASLLTDNGLVQALFNAPPGDWAAGERGIASLPGRQDEFKGSIETALRYADELGNDKIHVMAGLLDAKNEACRRREIYRENLAYAAEQALHHGKTIVIEPINPRDMPGYLLNYQADARTICQEVGAVNLKVQCDLYHCQIVEGDLAMNLQRHGAYLGHIQIAGVPDRHEPDAGEVNYRYLCTLIDQIGYTGWIGCEYVPRGDTSAGLQWLRQWASHSLNHDVIDRSFSRYII